MIHCVDLSLLDYSYMVQNIAMGPVFIISGESLKWSRGHISLIKVINGLLRNGFVLAYKGVF